mgnify:CR=1 FL=1
MKLLKVLALSGLLLTAASAQDVMQKSMMLMEKGMGQIQQGFINNNETLIREGAALVGKGNQMFNDPKVINQYLPKDKKHMINIAENASKRITLDINVLDLNLDDKAYINATNAYSDMLNACASCHSIVRSW